MDEPQGVCLKEVKSRAMNTHIYIKSTEDLIGNQKVLASHWLWQNKGVLVKCITITRKQHTSTILTTYSLVFCAWWCYVSTSHKLELSEEGASAKEMPP